MNRISVTLDPRRTGREAERLRAGLSERVIGQPEALRQMVDVYQTWIAGMSNPDRPAGSFLFLGPTGTGKTRAVEALAEVLTGDARAVIKIDCAEFQHSHEIAKLIGSPPGYLGHRETHPVLSQENLDRYHTETVKLSIVLFDEIEKASDALWNLLLGILDKGRLTLGDNRAVDFTQSMIFLTSNLGAREMASMANPALGFTVAAAPAAATKVARAGVDAARRRFTPEFMNRIDKMVVFRPLGDAELARILDLELDAVQRRIADARPDAPFALSVTAAARNRLLEEGTDARYGARHLKRAVERALVSPISNLIATGQVASGDLLHIDYDPGDDALAFSKEVAESAVAA